MVHSNVGTSMAGEWSLHNTDIYMGNCEKQASIAKRVK